MAKDHDTLSREQVDAIGMPSEEPNFLADALDDRMLEAIVALGGELWIERDRRHALETILESKGLISAAELESFTPDADTVAARNAELQAMVERVLGPLKNI